MAHSPTAALRGRCRGQRDGPHQGDRHDDPGRHRASIAVAQPCIARVFAASAVGSDGCTATGSGSPSCFALAGSNAIGDDRLVRGASGEVGSGR